MQRILYPGSFRPFHNEHLKNVSKIRSMFPNSELFIGVSEYCPRADSFLSSIEAVKLINLVLTQEGHLGVNVEIIKRDVLHGFMFLKENDINIVFSGSKLTLLILKYLKFCGFWNGDVYKLDNGGVHGSYIRDIVKTNCNLLHNLVPKCELNYLHSKGGIILKHE